jgi:hypothetical protein
MPRPRNDDIFAPVRRQATRVLTSLSQEIQRRESELRDLVSQANSWRAALGLGGRALHVGNGAGRRGRRPSAAPARRSGGKRVDWDQVLASVPKRFGVDHVMRHPGARSKGRAQIYPALTRWEATKKIRRIGKGQYEKVAGAVKARPAQPKAQRKARRGRPAAPAKRMASAKRPARSAKENGRVDWDSVLKGLPKTFGAADVLKNPTAAAKGQGQVFAAIGRWVATKRIKKVGKGQYERA